MNSVGRIDSGKKQLNLSAPLLSARRYSSPLRSSAEEITKESLPANKASNGEVVKPGAIPFKWEHIPGRVKSGANSQVHSPEDPPRLPPGRAGGVRSGELSFLRPHHKLSGELNGNRLPTKFLSGELPLLRAQTRPSSFPVHDMLKSAQFNNKATDDSGSDTDDLSFSDALDALDSYSINCSTGGLSASEIPITKACANWSADVGNRDFMMNRFLPAAKAMTLESPQYASKRQVVAVEPPQLSKVIVPKIVKGPQKNMAITLYTGQDIGSAQSEDEEEGGYDQPRNISVKSCGFFPWFCSKNALRLFNPVPAMKVKTKSALASASKVGRMVKNASYKSPSRANSKQLPPTQHHKQKVDHLTKSCELNRIESKPNTKLRPMFYSGELPTRNGNLQARNGLSPYRNYKRSSVSPYRNESSPYSPFHNAAAYPIVPKRVDNPDEHRSKTNDRASNVSGPMSFHQRNHLQGSCPGSPVTEKTLYVDSINIIRARQSSGRMDIIKARGVSKPTVDTKISQRSSIECQTDLILSKMMNQSFQSSNVVGNGHENSSRELVLRREDPAMQSPVPPPLPKSPSESWLSRNLNAVSPRNSVSHSQVGNKFQPRQQAAQTPNTDTTKWETIVKTSHLHFDYGRYSEELVARVPQQQLRARK